MSYIALATRRFDETLAFYHEKLGLELLDIFDRPGARGAFLDLGGGARLELIDASIQSRPMNLSDQADDRMHVVIETDDVQRKADLLGLPEPRRTTWNAIVSSLRDPDGVSVWFLQWLPSATDAITDKPGVI